jgi:hypothetical protein
MSLGFFLSSIFPLRPLLLSQPNPTQLRQDVEILCGWIRNPQHMQDLNDSAAFISGEWEKLLAEVDEATQQELGLELREQKFIYQDREFKNIILSLGPKDRTCFVIGAHYDVFGDQPGADDNASAVAGMLELSRLLVRNRVSLNHRLELVAYTLEENQFQDFDPLQGLPGKPDCVVGSGVHAQDLIDRGVSVDGMISLEMIGFYTDEKDSQQYPLSCMSVYYPNQGNFIGIVGYSPSKPRNASGQSWLSTLQQLWENAQEYSRMWILGRKILTGFRRSTKLTSHMLYVPFPLKDLDRSDHACYVQRGIPAYMITDTSFMRNNHYHSPADEPNTLDYLKMAEVVRGVYTFIATLP